MARGTTGLYDSGDCFAIQGSFCWFHMLKLELGALRPEAYQAMVTVIQCYGPRY